jgi:hypothetical protein
MANDIFESREMEGVDKLTAAQRAIVAMLARIKEHPQIGWYCGIGTRSFGLLTEAAAMLTDTLPDLGKLRRHYAENAGRDPQPFLEAAEEAADFLCDMREGSDGRERGDKLRLALQNFRQ